MNTNMPYEQLLLNGKKITVYTEKEWFELFTDYCQKSIKNVEIQLANTVAAITGVAMNANKSIVVVVKIALKQ